MNNSFKQFFKLASMVVLVGAATGCTNVVSHGWATDGTIKEPVFPELNQKAKNRATFVNTENLRKIGSDIGKDDLYHLLDEPHFAETHRAHEWDYTFKFRDWRVLDLGVNGNKNPITYCQYKIVFDKHQRAQSFFWNPASCQQLAEQAPSVPSRYRLSSEVLFHYDRSGTGDILQGGSAMVDRLAEQIRHDYATVDSIRVVGYTDRLGTHEYNASLSQQRANTIAAMLTQRGFDRSTMTTVGAGESNPVSQDCVGDKYTPTLAACLQVDRRVEVEVTGKKNAQ